MTLRQYAPAVVTVMLAAIMAAAVGGTDPGRPGIDVATQLAHPATMIGVTSPSTAELALRDRSSTTVPMEQARTSDLTSRDAAGEASAVWSLDSASVSYTHLTLPTNREV